MDSSYPACRTPAVSLMLEGCTLAIPSHARKSTLCTPYNAPYVGHVCVWAHRVQQCAPRQRAHVPDISTWSTATLLHLGYKVRYVRNITDVGHLTGDTDDGEDKIGKKARLENHGADGSGAAVHERLSRCDAGVPHPAALHRAHGHGPHRGADRHDRTNIIDNGFGYEANGSVYFDVRKYAEIARLRGAERPPQIDELQNQIAGARRTGRKARSRRISPCGRRPTRAT